jgi:hypothetical protein
MTEKTREVKMNLVQGGGRYQLSLFVGYNDGKERVQAILYSSSLLYNTQTWEGLRALWHDKAGV